jgi:hypothetical protein
VLYFDVEYRARLSITEWICVFLCAGLQWEGISDGVGSMGSIEVGIEHR